MPYDAVDVSYIFEPTLLKRCSFRKPFEIDDTDARSAQKTPAGVLAVRRGLFFVKRQRRCVVYFKRYEGRHIE